MVQRLVLSGQSPDQEIFTIAEVIRAMLTLANPAPDNGMGDQSGIPGRVEIGRDDPLFRTLPPVPLAFAAPPAGERVESIALDVAETITAHMRSPDMIWGLGRVDAELLDEMEAELRSITVAALTNALATVSKTEMVHPLPANREAIARVIWESQLLLHIPRNDWDTETAMSPKSAFVRLVREVADVILALSPTPSAGRDANECICPKCGLRHGGHGSRDPGF